jgi:hypothetical protein
MTNMRWSKNSREKLSSMRRPSNLYCQNQIRSDEKFHMKEHEGIGKLMSRKTKKRMIPMCLIFLSVLALFHFSDMDVQRRLTVEGNVKQKSRSLLQKEITPYTYLDSESIFNKLHELASTYPDLATVESAQELYSLPLAGGEDDCPFEHLRSETEKGCHNWILTISDSIANPKDVAENIPDVLLSGALHGDERVGPTTVMELAALLLEVTECESLPRIGKNGKNNNQYNSNEWVKDDVLPGTDKDGQAEAAWEEQVRKANECRLSLDMRGIYSSYRRWLSRLVSTRRIIIVPAINSLGYFRNHRREGTDDPNRDFPFQIDDPKQCMKTIAGRTMNEIYQSHLIQSAITFHGGTEAIAYEWGAPFYQIDLMSSFDAPDGNAQREFANVLSSYSGSFQQTKDYPTGTMNELVYPVKGGMEDWSYAGSWDTDKVKPCEPDTYGGYDRNKTVYGPAVLRSNTLLVETSDQKQPKINALGTNEDLFSPYSATNGHISRNIRLALATIDLVEPYVTFVDVEGINIGDDLYPLSPRPITRESCESTRVISVPEGLDRVKFLWTVGGSTFVDTTALMVGPWKDLDNNIFGCVKQPTKQNLDAFFDTIREDPEKKKRVFFTDPVVSGKTIWHPDLEYPDVGAKSMITDESVFTTEIDISQYEEGEIIAVYAVARVDQNWYDISNSNIKDHLPPQSHWVNARTNPEWRYTVNDKTVQGQLDWFSIPITIRIGKSNSPIIDVSKRTPEIIEDVVHNNDSASRILKGILIGISAVVAISVCIFVREKSNGDDIFAIWKTRRDIYKSAIPQEEYDPNSFHEDDDDDQQIIS